MMGTAGRITDQEGTVVRPLQTIAELEHRMGAWFDG
jgi:hypothetical protein